MEELFQMMLHADVLISDFVSQYGTLTYWIVFVIIFLETGLVVTNFFPGDSLLFSAGLLAATGQLHLLSLMLLLFLATLLGNTSNYLIGRFIGGHFFKKHNKKKTYYLKKAATFIEKYGIKSVIVSRFIPFMRSFVPFVSGITRMKFWRYTWANVIGGVLWIVFYLLLGYYFGEIPVVKENLGVVFLLMILIVILTTFMAITKLLWRRSNRVRQR